MNRRPFPAIRRAVLDWRKARAPVAVILMYHRITPIGMDPWDLGVTPEHFKEHLDVIRRIARPTSLDALVRDIRQRRVADRSVIVTFDDGFADNVHAAKPLLEHADVPATVYVTSGLTGTTREFWWDELDHLLLVPGRLPVELRLSSGRRARQWTLGEASTGAWTRGEPDDAQRARLTFHEEVWAFLLPLPHEEQRELLDELRRWSRVGYEPRPSHRVMGADEIIRLGSGGLVDIGAHTVSHPHLPSMTPAVRQAEMQGSRRALEAILGRPVSSFSYPYGAVTPSISTLARAVGFTSAVAAFGQTAWHDDNPCCLPRFAVRDWDGDEFERQLRGWFDQHSAP